MGATGCGWSGRAQGRPGGADGTDVDRLAGIVADEPLYAIERFDDDADVELGFSDWAAHVHESLVGATVDVIAAVPGVLDAWHEDREVILVRAPGVPLERLAEVVDRLWLDALGLRPGGRPEPGAAVPGGPVDADGAFPAPSWVQVPVPDRDRRSALSRTVHLAPSRRRMWSYLAAGAICTLGGAVLAITPDGSTGVAPLVLGVANLAVGTRIAARRRTLGL